jgi:cytidine deaminase
MLRTQTKKLPALLRAATRARSRAWAPYSEFPVGAAVLAGGKIYVGCNVENSSYPLSVCAERNAIAAAVVAGHESIEAVAIVGGIDRPSAPCGGCRQVLAEFCAPETPILYAAADGQSVLTNIAALLPHSFGRADLLRAEAAGSAGSKRDTRPRSAARKTRK